MTQFCALFFNIYALLASQRGGMAPCSPPPKYATDQSRLGIIRVRVRDRVNHNLNLVPTLIKASTNSL